MYPWPTCCDCERPMPWLAQSKKVCIHRCDCGVVVLLEGGSDPAFFRAVYASRDIANRFPHLFSEKAGKLVPITP